MINLVEYITKDLAVKSILQIDTTGNPLKSLFNSLHEIDPKIWSIVLSTKNSPRWENRNAYELIYGTFENYKPLIQFDLLIITDPLILRSVLFGDSENIKKLTKAIMYSEPIWLKGIENAFPPFLELKKFYFLNPYLEFLPLNMQKYLSKYRLFSDRKEKRYCIGKL